MKTITIKKQDYVLKYTLRAFFIFENFTGRQFAFGRMLDEYLLFYSILLANNKDTFLMSFDEFVEACDSDPSLFASFKEFFVKQIELLEQAADADIKKKDSSEETCSVRELYARVVGEGGVAPDYFLDKMTLAEVRCFLEGLIRRNRESWEQTRIVAYVIAQANSTRDLEPSDVLCFPWDVKEEKGQTTVTDEEMEMLREKAKLIEKEINHG
nr:hypothetical protein [Bacteroides hominis (ex Liu et al. 2022)]MDV6156499.1 hypothetical protein [Bacteroides hominis (ex Liu et al. 2022)]